MIELALGAGLAILIFLIWYQVNIIPFVFIGGLFFLLYRMSTGKMPNLNNQSVGKLTTAVSGIHFEQIGGQEIAKKELLEALDFIKNPSRIQEMGIRPLKGILMVGPPGTGKTLLAKAAAGYTNSIFISSSGSEFIEMYAGVGAQRIRQLFKQCRQKAKQQNKNSAVLFIDEIDILGSTRGSHSSHMEYDQTLNQLLTEMDGIGNHGDSQENLHILVIGATNRHEALDRALVRPGRFDRTIQVELPDWEGRLEILKLHSRNKPLGKDVNLEKISREAYGFSGAQLESLSNEAAIIAMREESGSVCQKHFMEAIDKVMMGEKSESKPDKNELWRIALHECGHALISEIIKPGSVSVVTITPRGKSLGYIRQHPEKDHHLYTKEFMENQICLLLGGSMSEKIMLGDQSTGAANDFYQSVELAKKIINSGLSGLGVISESHLSSQEMHQTIKDIIAQQQKRALKMLKPNTWLIKEASNILLEKEKITGEYLRSRLLSRKRFWNRWKDNQLISSKN